MLRDLEPGVKNSLGRGIITGVENVFKVGFKRCMIECGRFTFEITPLVNALSDDELKMKAIISITVALINDGWDVSQEFSEVADPDVLYVGGHKDRAEIRLEFYPDPDVPKIEFSLWKEL